MQNFYFIRNSFLKHLCIENMPVRLCGFFLDMTVEYFVKSLTELLALRRLHRCNHLIRLTAKIPELVKTRYAC